MYKFNPQKDIMRAVPDMSVDLAAAIESGVVLDTGMISEHNDIDSPASVIGRVRDVFDAFEAQKRILNAGRVSSVVDPVAAPAVESSSTPVKE